MFRNEGVIVVHVQLGALALPRLLPHGDLDRDQVVSHHVVLRRLQQQRRLFVDVGATAGVRNARNGRRFRDGRFPREILYVGEDVGTCGIEQKRGRLLKGFQVPATISAKEIRRKSSKLPYAGPSTSHDSAWTTRCESGPGRSVHRTRGSPSIWTSSRGSACCAACRRCCAVSSPAC